MILSTFLITSNTYYIKYFFPIRIFDFVHARDRGPNKQTNPEPATLPTYFFIDEISMTSLGGSRLHGTCHFSLLSVVGRLTVTYK